MILVGFILSSGNGVLEIILCLVFCFDCSTGKLCGIMIRMYCSNIDAALQAWWWIHVSNTHDLKKRFKCFWNFHFFFDGDLIVEEEGQGTEGRKCDPWTYCKRWRTCFWCGSHFCIVQWHIHSEYSVDSFAVRIFSYLFSEFGVQYWWYFFSQLQHVTDLSGRETLVRITGIYFLFYPNFVGY